MVYQILTVLNIVDRDHSTKINQNWFHNLFMKSPHGYIKIELCDSLDDLMETEDYQDAIRYINLMSNIKLFDYLFNKIKDTISKNLKSQSLESMYNNVNDSKIDDDIAFKQMFEIINDTKYLQAISK